MELIAQAPDLKHPSVVCAAPDGRVFVAEDPMDISAPRADAQEGRVLCFRSDGTRSVFADHLHAVFGMQYLEGKLYVLHNPKFTVFTDHNGVGAERVDLIESVQPTPWALDWNDHVPANFRLAMDGYFYLAVGDKGVYGAVGRDGRRVDIHGGGVLRLRPDGTELEIYCSGTRNILDVALNAEDEMFTYDNTDEHDWMGRLTHMVDGGFYGYPHDFVPRRPYTLWMMHDFGGGAATGTLVCNEDALPPEYRGNLFLADFGKRQVLRVGIERAGGTYRVAAHEEFFRSPPDDFRPVGIAWSDDGLSLLVCDWQHRDTKENVEVGRLWKATYTGASPSVPKPSWYVAAATGKPFAATTGQLVAALSHPSRNVRLTAQRRLAERKETGPLIALLQDSSTPPWARWHALWALDGIDGGRAARAAVRRAVEDADASVRRQAIRELGGRRASEVGELLRVSLKDADASIRFQAATALGRIGDAASVPVLLAALTGFASRKDVEAGLRERAIGALGRLKAAEAVGAVAAQLDAPDTAVRAAAIRALGQIGGDAALQALRTRARDPAPETRRQAIIAMGMMRDTNAVPDLLAAWKSGETRVQALDSLTRVSDARAVEAYLEALASANAMLREQTRKALGSIRDELLPVLEKRSADLKPEVLAELRRVYAEHSRAALGPLFASKQRDPDVPDYENFALGHAGDVRRGQRVFFDESGVACIKCHAVAGHGGAVGPDLTLIGAQFPRATLIEHVLYPSKVVREGYQQVIVELRDGESVSGLMRGETADALTLVDGEARPQTIAKSNIAGRTMSQLSLMPEGLQVGLTLEQFADLIAYLESRQSDPRQTVSDPAPDGFAPLFNGRDLAGWREVPDQPMRVSSSTEAAPAIRHWTARDSILEHDGKAGDLWTEGEFGDFTLRLDWRWPDRPGWEEFPLITFEGEEQRVDGRPVTERALDAGDSGVFLRGLRKAQVNLFCYPVGSGEVRDYRTNPKLIPEQGRAVTPNRQADAPIGDWNRMEITLRGNRLTVALNGVAVITNAELPGLPARGPVGLRHGHGRIEFRNLFVRELR